MVIWRRGDLFFLLARLLWACCITLLIALSSSVFLFTTAFLCISFLRVMFDSCESGMASP